MFFVEINKNYTIINNITQITIRMIYFSANSNSIILNLVYYKIFLLSFISLETVILTKMLNSNKKFGKFKRISFYVGASYTKIKYFLFSII